MYRRDFSITGKRLFDEKTDVTVKSHFSRRYCRDLVCNFQVQLYKIYQWFSGASTTFSLATPAPYSFTVKFIIKFYCHRFEIVHQPQLHRRASNVPVWNVCHCVLSTSHQIEREILMFKQFKITTKKRDIENDKVRLSSRKRKYGQRFITANGSRHRTNSTYVC